MSSCENPATDKDALMTRRQKFDGKTKICVKCKENTGNIVIRYAVYCKSCFFPLIQTRFRKSLEPSINAIPDGPRRKGLKAAGSLVVAFSGGTSSTALLDLVAKTYFALKENDDNARGGKEHPRNLDKQIWQGRPVVCYVDVSGAFPEEESRTDAIRAVVDGYPGSPFEFVPLKLEDAFDKTWWAQTKGGDLSQSAQSLGLDISDEELRLAQTSTQTSSAQNNPETSPLTALLTYLTSLPTQTAFFASIKTLIRVLLLNTAASRDASHLLLGTSLTSLSVNLISGIAQGAGFAVAEEAVEEWTPREVRGVEVGKGKGLTVRVLRPLRDVGMKECAIWDWWCGLRIVGSPRKYVQGGGRSSIGSLTRDFIFGLESDYPATVSTVARTCAKLTPKEGSDGVCVLCERPAQHGVQDWKSSISIRSYHEASSAVTGSTRPPHLTEEEIANLVRASPNTHTSTNTDQNGTPTPEPSLTPRLCYACHTTLTSRSSRGGGTTALPPGQSLHAVPAPVWVQSAMSRGDMKAQISEFLLDDDDA